MFPKPFIRALTERIKDIYEENGKAMIAIGGRGCAGKTTLGSQIIANLGTSALCLAFDDFFTPFSLHDISKTGPSRYWRLSDYEATVKSLSHTGHATYQPYSWRENDSLLSAREISSPLVIAEGLYVVSEHLLPYYDLAIWVEGRLDNRMDRILNRDGAFFLDRWIEEWIPDEEAYLLEEQPWQNVDLVVAGADASFTDLHLQLSMK